MPNQVIMLDEVSHVDVYPSGETHAHWKAIPQSPDTCIIAPNVRTWTDLMTIRSLDDALKRIGSPLPMWFIPYFPFARDDRRRKWTDADTLHLAVETVGESLRHRIIVADPHSYATEIFRHIHQQFIVETFIEAGLFAGNPWVAIPDKGATHKAMEWIPGSPSRGYVQCDKVRDPQTGDLTGFSVPEDTDFCGEPVVIIDDICDGGGTFLGLADELKKHNAGELRLGVTHGLFTKGKDVLKQKFSHVVSADGDWVNVLLKGHIR